MTLPWGLPILIRVDLNPGRRVPDSMGILSWCFYNIYPAFVLRRTDFFPVTFPLRHHRKCMLRPRRVRIDNFTSAIVQRLNAGEGKRSRVLLVAFLACLAKHKYGAEHGTM